MKKYVLAAALILVASSSFAVITGSKHDMSASGPSATYGRTGVDQICIYCHAPHNATNSQLLWNRNNTTATITMYDAIVSGTLNYSTPATLHDTSKTCLGCHDGTIAVDEYAGVAGTTGKEITGTKKLSTDLTKSHPIGISYQEALTNGDTGLTPITGGKVIKGATTLQLFGSSNDQVECATCHDVHNKMEQNSLLQATNSASALCLTCHIK